MPERIRLQDDEPVFPSAATEASKMEEAVTRRNFMKAAGIAGGATLVSGLVPPREAFAAPSEEAGVPDPLLNGVCDIHVHAAPDTKNRLIDEFSFCVAAQKAGYRAVMFKSNEWSCHDRAYLIRQALPGFACFGSLCMNRVHGDKVNVHAAAMAVKTTGNLCRCIWMPTQAASWQHIRENLPGKGIPVLDDAGNVLPEVVRVMEICAEADIIFATGHSSPEESLVLARKAREVGVGKFVVTHANSGIWKMTREQILRVADLGGFLEYSYLTNLAGPGTGLPTLARMSDEEFIRYAGIVPERSFISTDLGQVNMPHPLDGMRRCITALLQGGMSRRDVDLMVRSNPARLLGLDA